MVIKHGWYKDLSGITSEQGENPKVDRLAEEKFYILVNGQFTKDKGKITDEEFFTVPKAFITHHITDAYANTTYFFVFGDKSVGGSAYIRHCKEYCCGIDREHSLIVLERTEDRRTENKGREISFPELKNMMIRYYESQGGIWSVLQKTILLLHGRIWILQNVLMQS